MVKIVIVGGVAGGASAAARARRLSEEAEIVMLQRDGDVSYASCGMPYFIGGEITDRSKMAVQTPKTLKDRLNIDVRVSTDVVEIKTAHNSVVALDRTTGKQYEESYDHLILAVGAAPLKPPIPGIDRPGLFALRNLDDMDAIFSWINKKSSTAHAEDLHCVVAGAGFVGLEMVEQLHKRGFAVSVVEMMPQILGPLDEEMAAYLHRDLEQRGVHVIVGDGIKTFDADVTDLEATVVSLQSGRKLPAAQLTILGLGVRPDTKVVQSAGIVCTPRGHIVVNDHLLTSVPNVWAAGDSVEIRNPILGGEEKWTVPLAGPANRQGRMVADNIFGKNRSYKGTFGVSVVRIFDLYAATVGLNEKFLMAKNIPYAVKHIHPNSHAGYYPGAQAVHFKLIFDKESGKIFGAQAVGKDGVEKRIDVVATAMQGNLTVDDLAELELCYAPPVGSAKDPVNYAGMAAQNVVEGLVSDIQWKDVEAISKDPETVLLDVRNPSELVKKPFSDNAVNIPLNDLRGRLGELPKEKRIVVMCFSGQRAYYASRILMQNGFGRVINLDGAYATFHEARPDTIL